MAWVHLRYHRCRRRFLLGRGMGLHHGKGSRVLGGDCMSDESEDSHANRVKELKEHDRNSVFRFCVWIAVGFALSAVVVAVTGSLQAALALFGFVVLAAMVSGD
jgi:hypothetical protein